ncbi:hypothetical protein [Amycolatopsis sp. DSM 110486]|uniref:hypothetical protein n=1 Tax=Amycolatopsis sp. DSM 110486 TaxID=2865832 RepID=UPI001C6986FB|nr:hypothetical protein [Amycolatopsis sp. DSM 110486]QYN17462.1 hypothetical protein K1T34_32260 [Amycolatopsis sp. DSM 110486]
MSDTYTLLCQGVGANPRIPVAARPCASCGTGLWVSSSMVARVDAGEIKTSCFNCTPGRLSEDAVATIHPDQVNELRGAGVLDAARDLLIALNTGYERPGTRPR